VKSHIDVLTHLAIIHVCDQWPPMQLRYQLYVFIGFLCVLCFYLYSVIWAELPEIHLMMMMIREDQQHCCNVRSPMLI